MRMVSARDQISAMRSAAGWLTFLTVAFVSIVPAQAWQAAKTTSKAKDEIPEPVDEKIVVREGNGKLTMTCTYFPSTLGKEAVPILMLHGYGGSRADYDDLAYAMQREGHAVLVPDLRGHGGTTSFHFDNTQKRELLYKNLLPADYNALVSDVDGLKSWLLEKNNAGELNLEMLVVIGADMTTITAMNWALRDWTAPLLLNYKNAQDVKALILLSPDTTFKNTNIKTALSHPIVGGKLSTMIIVGTKSPGPHDEAKRLYNTLQRQHKEVNTTKKAEDLEVVYVPVETNLQGTKLLDKSFKVSNAISAFIKFRVKSKIEDFDFTERIKP